MRTRHLYFFPALFCRNFDLCGYTKESYGLVHPSLLSMHWKGDAELSHHELIEPTTFGDDLMIKLLFDLSVCRLRNRVHSPGRLSVRPAALINRSPIPPVGSLARSSSCIPQNTLRKMDASLWPARKKCWLFASISRPHHVCIRTYVRNGTLWSFEIGLSAGAMRQGQTDRQIDR